MWIKHTSRNMLISECYRNVAMSNLVRLSKWLLHKSDLWLYKDVWKWLHELTISVDSEVCGLTKTLFVKRDAVVEVIIIIIFFCISSEAALKTWRSYYPRIMSFKLLNLLLHSTAASSSESSGSPTYLAILAQTVTLCALKKEVTSPVCG